MKTNPSSAVALATALAACCGLLWVATPSRGAVPPKVPETPVVPDTSKLKNVKKITPPQDIPKAAVVAKSQPVTVPKDIKKQPVVDKPKVIPKPVNQGGTADVSVVKVPKKPVLPTQAQDQIGNGTVLKDSGKKLPGKPGTEVSGFSGGNGSSSATAGSGGQASQGGLGSGGLGSKRNAPIPPASGDDKKPGLIDVSLDPTARPNLDDLQTNRLTDKLGGDGSNADGKGGSVPGFKTKSLKDVGDSLAPEARGEQGTSAQNSDNTRSDKKEESMVGGVIDDTLRDTAKGAKSTSDSVTRSESGSSPTGEAARNATEDTVFSSGPTISDKNGILVEKSGDGKWTRVTDANNGTKTVVRGDGSTYTVDTKSGKTIDTSPPLADGNKKSTSIPIDGDSSGNKLSAEVRALILADVAKMKPKEAGTKVGPESPVDNPTDSGQGDFTRSGPIKDLKGKLLGGDTGAPGGKPRLPTTIGKPTIGKPGGAQPESPVDDPTNGGQTDPGGGGKAPAAPIPNPAVPGAGR